jgi:hypothetical protein
MATIFLEGFGGFASCTSHSDVLSPLRDGVLLRLFTPCTYFSVGGVISTPEATLFIVGGVISTPEALHFFGMHTMGSGRG